MRNFDRTSHGLDTISISLEMINGIPMMLILEDQLTLVAVELTEVAAEHVDRALAGGVNNLSERDQDITLAADVKRT